jgi:hypothetical protein
MRSLAKEKSMHLNKLGRVLAVCGMLMVLIGLSAVPAQGAPLPAPALAPSPRPTLAPERSRSDRVWPPATGRLTGTVIDNATGSPSAGISVLVGGTTLVYSDLNGNYDTWVVPGTYTVTLVLDPAQGTLLSEVPAVAEVIVDQTTTLHLYYQATAPAGQEAPVVATPVVEQVAEPVAEETTPIEAAVAPPTAVPAAPEAPVVDAPVGTSEPNRLPRTSQADNTATWMWISLGFMLLMGGITLEFMRKRAKPVVQSANPRNTKFENARFLATLMTEDKPEAKTSESEILLSALLTNDMDKNEK